MDYMEERIDLTREYVKHPLSTFMVECTGDSMINAFIPPGARLLVDRSITAQNGDIVLNDDEHLGCSYSNNDSAETG